jgi:hypothetical protein
MGQLCRNCGGSLYLTALGRIDRLGRPGEWSLQPASGPTFRVARLQGSTVRDEMRVTSTVWRLSNQVDSQTLRRQAEPITLAAPESRRREAVPG